MSDDMLPVETLQRLARQDGVDTRPILVRVVTDLFVQREHHSPEEIAQFEELVIGLLGAVGVEARAAVARKLADEPRTPAALVAKLLTDVEEVKAPLLARFPNLSRSTLLEIALDGGPVETAAIASRADISPDMTRLLAHHPDDLTLETLAANPAATFTDAVLGVLVERAVETPALAAALLRRDDLDPAALAPLYLTAEPTRRAEIRKALEARPNRLAFAARPAKAHEALDAALETAAMQHGQGHVIAEALADAHGLKPDVAARLATEPSGEAFVMMLRAAGVDADLVARALLVAQPEIATSVVRVFDLVDIAETTSRVVAAEIVAALVGHSDRATAPRHEPLFDPTGVMERAGAARAAPQVRRPAAKYGDLGRQRG